VTAADADNTIGRISRSAAARLQVRIPICQGVSEHKNHCVQGRMVRK
jgi:hypothetical protein